MVYPLRGPFEKGSTRSVPLPTGGSALQMFEYRAWYTQRKPWNIPLNFYFQRDEVLGSYGMSGGQPYIADTAAAVPGGFLSNGAVLAYNKAYSRLIDSMGSQSQWAVNVAEQKSSLNMIVGRLGQIRDFTKAVRRADVVGAARVLRSSVPSKFQRGKPKKATWSDTWLEFHFGWAPLIDDISNAIDSFTDPHLSTSRPIKGSASVKLQGKTGNITYSEAHRAKLGCSISIDNPNLHLASRLGLINPLSVAWELVPFSFVVDWFTNVGQVLSSYSDFAGVSQINPYRTSHSTGTYSKVLNPTTGDSALKVLTVRVPGPIPGPTLAMPPFKGLSPVRGITAVALLLQSMK